MRFVRGRQVAAQGLFLRGMKKHVIGRRQQGLTRFEGGDAWKSLLVSLGMLCLFSFRSMRKTEEKAVGTSSEGGRTWARSGDMRKASELRVTIIRG